MTGLYSKEGINVLSKYKYIRLSICRGNRHTYESINNFFSC